MGLFSNKKEGGLMDVIRCDDQDYLIKKWSPSGEINSSNKENAIRYGSSLRVKDGEAAIFVYKQPSGQMQDVIIGPYDETIKTANFPILSSIVGLAFGGKSPFQAEVYFINLQGNNQVKFGVPYFDVFDPRFLDFGVPICARGRITFNITDIQAFIKLNRLINFDLDDFNKQIKDTVIKYTKGFIANAPTNNNIPVVQIERKIVEISDLLQEQLQPIFVNDFGVNLKRFDMSAIELDKESEGYIDLIKVTKNQQTKTVEAQTNVSIKNLEDIQNINSQNMEETLRIQREEAQRAQKLQTETNFIGAHAINQQTEVLKSAADSLGSMGSVDCGGHGMNPAGMMTGMMMGGAMGGQMATMMNQMGGNMKNQMNTPPPLPKIEFMLAINGEQYGPFSISQIQQLINEGKVNGETLAWRQGLDNWTALKSLADTSNLFATSTPPPIPKTL